MKTYTPALFIEGAGKDRFRALANNLSRKHRFRAWMHYMHIVVLTHTHMNMAHKRSVYLRAYIHTFVIEGAGKDEFRALANNLRSVYLRAYITFCIFTRIP